jgi:hypothetical protein
MADREPQVIDEEQSALAEIEAQIDRTRTDERRKLLAELTDYLDTLDDRLVSEGTLASNTGVGVALASVRGWARIHADGGANDKDLPGESDGENIAHNSPPVSPSSEPARAGDDELRNQMEATLIFCEGTLALVKRGHPFAAEYVDRSLASLARCLRAAGFERPDPNHEEGSAHG